MTTPAFRNPRAATCEDVEEDYEPSRLDSGSNPDANVARKRSQSHRSDTKSSHDKKSYNGSDSGYSSKAGTNDDISSGRRKVVDLKIATNNNMERERQPYVYKPSRPVPSSQSSFKSKEVIKDKILRQQEKRFKHVPGECVTCDHYGYHIEPAPPILESTQQSPKLSRKTSTKTKDDSTTRQKPRRQSSTRETRPVPVYMGPPQPINYAPEYTHHVAQQSPYGYQMPTPITPTTNVIPYHHHQQQQQQQQQHLLDTPVSTSYLNVHPGYFESQIVPHDVHQPAQQYIQYQEHFEPVPPYYVHYQNQELQQRHPSYGSTIRPVIVKTNKSIEDDKKAMPPPTRPLPRTASTDKSSKRQSVRYEADERPDVTSKRSSRDISHLPSAYSQTRPRPSKSYSTGSEHIQVSTTQRPRHNTDPSGYNDFVDQCTANAESYIAKTSKGPTNDLTAESLKKMSPKPLASDSGTHRTNRSKESSRSKVSTKTTIVMENGVSVSLPQDIQESFTLKFGKLSLSVNNQDQEDGIAEQRAIEARAANGLSRAPSRRSTTSDGSRGAQPLTRDAARKLSQSERAGTSAHSSKKSSRTPSSTRGNLDYDQRRSLANGNDHPEVFYGA